MQSWWEIHSDWVARRGEAGPHEAEPVVAVADDRDSRPALTLKLHSNAYGPNASRTSKRNWTNRPAAIAARILEVRRWRNVRLWIDARIGPSISLARNKWRRYDAAEPAAGQALATLLDRSGVKTVDGIAEFDVSFFCKTCCVSTVAGRHHAVEEIDPGGDGVEDVLRAADAHQVARPVAGQKVGRDGERLADQLAPSPTLTPPTA